MSVARLDEIPGFNIDRVAAAAGDDPDVLRLENLDTDIPPPAEAMEATRAAIGEDEANSWLPFTGRDDLKEAVATYIESRGGPRYDGSREIVITCGEGDAMLDALFCLTDPGDEVILSDPTYAGMLNRVRLVRAVPRLVPLHVADGEWRLDLEALPAAVTERTRVVFATTPPFRPAGSRATRSGRRLPRSAASGICGSSTGPGTRASSSTAGQSGIPPRFRAWAIERSPSAPRPWSSG
jgi:N-succinyldiaminopimelate aminotransferase